MYTKEWRFKRYKSMRIQALYIDISMIDDIWMHTYSIIVSSIHEELLQKYISH